MYDQPPAYDQNCLSMAAGYSPHEAGFSTQPGYNPVPQGYKSPPHGYPSAQGAPMVGINQQSSTVVSAIFLIIIIYALSFSNTLILSAYLIWTCWVCQEFIT